MYDTVKIKPLFVLEKRLKAKSHLLMLICSNIFKPAGNTKNYDMRNSCI